MSETQRIAIQHDNPEGRIRLFFAHGAGAGLRSDFMQFSALAFALEGFEVVRFNFPFWQSFMETGVRRPPNRMAELDHCMRAVVGQFSDDKPFYLVGKSMGARVAFRLATELGAQGAIALGFPFHPVKKPNNLRLDDLVNECRSNLIVQGTKDKMGTAREVANYTIPENIELKWIEEGNHSFEPLKRTGLDRAELWQNAIDHCVAFIKNQQDINQ